MDSTISFGASTRTYILREKPKPVQVFVDTDGDQSGSGLLGLPEDETEMDVCEAVQDNVFVYMCNL